MLLDGLFCAGAEAKPVKPGDTGCVVWNVKGLPACCACPFIELKAKPCWPPKRFDCTGALLGVDFEVVSCWNGMCLLFASSPVVSDRGSSLSEEGPKTLLPPNGDGGN
jgi:hypothetical protein